MNINHVSSIATKGFNANESKKIATKLYDGTTARVKIGYDKSGRGDFECLITKGDNIIAGKGFSSAKGLPAEKVASIVTTIKEDAKDGIAFLKEFLTAVLS